MSLFVSNLMAAVDLTGLAVYATVMAFFLGSVSLARLRDEAIAAHKARRRGR